MSRFSICLGYLSVVLLGGSGCVVPIEPEFSDPSVNYPPFVVSASPPVGSLLGTPKESDPPTTIEVKLADYNFRDALYARWLLDYLPWSESFSRNALETILPPADGLERPTLRFTPSCLDDRLKSERSLHRVTLAVSDRPFLDGDSADPMRPWDTPSPGAQLLEVAWLIELSCQ